MQSSVSHLRAIGHALAGFTFWVLSDVCMKLVGEAALPPYEVVGFMGLSGVLFMLLKAWPQGNIKSLWPKHPRSQIGRALLSFGCVFLNAIALKHLPLTLFYVAVFTAPMLIAILAAVFLRERLKTPGILAIAAGFVGVMVAINPLQNIAQGNWVGYIAVFASTLCFAVNVTWLRVMTQSETGESIAFFTALVEALLGFGLMLGHVEFFSGKIFLILMMMGLFCVIGNLAEYKALQNTTAANVAQFHYTQIIAGAAFGYLIWHEVPKLHVLVGAIVIIASGLYIAAHARKMQNLAAISPR